MDSTNRGFQKEIVREKCGRRRRGPSSPDIIVTSSGTKAEAIHRGATPH
jgi:hypothetical protein